MKHNVFACLFSVFSAIKNYWTHFLTCSCVFVRNYPASRNARTKCTKPFVVIVRLYLVCELTKYISRKYPYFLFGLYLVFLFGTSV